MNILFIGGSIIGSGGTDKGLEQLASPTKEVFVTNATFPKATLEQHWQREETQTLLQSKSWEAVVLQEQGLRPLQDPEKMSRSIALWVEAIQSKGAKAFLFVPWRRREHNAATWKQICAIHQEIAQKLGLAICPVGECWARFLSAAPEVVLLEPGTNHANPAGALLSAASLVLSLFHIAPSESSLRDAGFPAMHLGAAIESLQK